MQEGHVPPALKNSRIVPIFKSGKLSSATNYRPVVIIPTIAKVFERVVYNKIVEFVNERIVHNQHGFVKNRSTSTNLLQMVNFTIDSMIARCQTDVLYTDFEKAFDRVNHKRLLQKLVKFGFGCRLIKWFYSYLTFRTQSVRIGGSNSRTFTVSSGVPAGSVLGPCLFTVFVNDIVDIVSNAMVLLFADDLKLIMRISSPSDAELFQSAIDQLNEWCALNQLCLNLKKCFVMTYSKRTNIQYYDYAIDNGRHKFERVQLHRDLGVIFDRKLSFVNHIDAITASASGAMGFIKRTLKDKFTIECAKLLYCALVRSKLEYCSIVWQPYHLIHSNRIESIQKNFVLWALRGIFRRDENYRLPPYQMRVEFLKMQPLWRRRINSSIFLIYDLLLGNVVSLALRERIVYTRQQYNDARRNLRSNELVRLEVSRTEYAHNQPFHVSCRHFNKVREEFLKAESRWMFRQSVINVDNLVFV